LYPYDDNAKDNIKYINTFEEVIFLSRNPVDPNAINALNQMKLEIANELGITNNFANNSGSIDESVQNIFYAGSVGGNMTRRLVELGEKQLIDKNK
jgi:type II secretory pathway component PulF